jgi:membrane-associated phospholipid phosphatase
MEKILQKVYRSKRATLAFKVISSLSVMLSVVAYCALLFLSFYSSIYEGISVFVSAALPFFAVGFVRMMIDAPRPYELYDFYEVKPKERAGRSFPSRHAYSSFVIATIAFVYSVPLGIGLSLIGLALIASRVLLGIHFIRDVVCGAAIGIISGLIGIFFVILPNVL